MFANTGMTNSISFPRLFDAELQINEVLFSVGPFAIRLYAVIIMSGFLLALWYASKRVGRFNTNSDQIYDVLLYALPAAIVGARAYFVLNSLEYFRQNPGAVFRIWEGGLAIYGAVIGAFVTVVLYSFLKKVDLLNLLDLGSIGLLIGQSVGRWGNFVNAEAFGVETTLPWGMSIGGAPTVHPAFLYESMWNLLGFLVLHRLSYNRRFKGEMLLLYLTWYGAGRAVIEGLRTDSLYLGSTGIRISQLLAIVSVVLAGGLWLYMRLSKKYRPIDPLTGRYEGEAPAYAGEGAVCGDTGAEADRPGEEAAQDGAVLDNQAAFTPAEPAQDQLEEEQAHGDNP